MKNDNLKSRVSAWVSGRNTSGVNGTALLLESFQYIAEHGDKTVLARMAAIQEQSTAKNIKRIMGAFGLKPVADKKQPSGIRVDMLTPEGHPKGQPLPKWSLADHAPALARLQKAVDDKLSIAGKKIASAEFFMTDKERASAAKRDAEAAEAEAEAAPEPEAEAEAAPAPVESISEDDAIAEIEQLFMQISTDAMQPLLNRLAAVYQAAMEAEIDATIATESEAVADAA